MRVLVDTQALFWWYSEPARLSRKAASIISDGSNTVLVSAATAWELSIKSTLGKMDAIPLVMELASYLSEEGFIELPISISHVTRAGLLPSHHRDLFDRLLMAQAQELSIPIVRSDRWLDRYGILRLVVAAVQAPIFALQC